MFADVLSKIKITYILHYTEQNSIYFQTLKKLIDKYEKESVLCIDVLDCKEGKIGEHTKFRLKTRKIFRFLKRCLLVNKKGGNPPDTKLK